MVINPDRSGAAITLPSGEMDKLSTGKGQMIARILSLGVAAVLINLSHASAAVAPSGIEISPEVEEGGIQLAQIREVDIFIDEYGREVLVDAWTGQVIGIREQRERQFERPRDFGWGLRERPRDPYYMDERSRRAIERRERRMRELGRDRDLPVYRDHGGYYDDYDDPYYDDYPYAEERFPLAPEPRWQEPEPPTASMHDAQPAWLTYALDE